MTSSFQDQVAAAGQRAAADEAMQVQRAREVDRARGRELVSLLSAHAEDIRSLPAELAMTEDLVTLRLVHEGRALEVQVQFLSRHWDQYLLTWSTSDLHTFAEGSVKAATPEETLGLLVEMAGRHQKGLPPLEPKR